jgi:hypothetical protein
MTFSKVVLERRFSLCYDGRNNGVGEFMWDAPALRKDMEKNMFRHHFRWTALAVAVVSCLAASLSRADDKDGYVSLFNGKDMTGWKIHPDTNKGAFVKITEKKEDGKVVALIGTGKDGKETTMWQVKDGLLIGGGAMSHIYTEGGDYSNFHFRVEMKINNKGNSGMFFRAGFRGGVPKGYEAQLNATHGDRVKTGSIYPNGEFGLDKFKAVTCVMDKAAHGPDEFFVQEVSANGPKLTTIVNGKVQIEWTDPDHRFKSGHFALQAHDPGSVMTFKRVEVKVIK